jgi:hypothetical protein
MFLFETATDARTAATCHPITWSDLLLDLGALRPIAGISGPILKLCHRLP